MKKTLSFFVIIFVFTVAFFVYSPFWFHFVRAQYFLLQNQQDIACEAFVRAANLPPRFMEEKSAIVFEKIIRIVEKNAAQKPFFFNFLFAVLGSHQPQSQKWKPEASKLLFSASQSLFKDKAQEGIYLSLMEKAKTYLPDSSSPDVMLGNFWREKKNLTKAALFYDQALKKNPFEPSAFHFLVRFYSHKKDYEKIAMDLYPYLENVQGDFSLYLLFGRSLLHVQRPMDAVFPLRKALDLDPQSSVARQLLGRCGEILGDMSLMDLFLDDYRQNPENSESAMRWLTFHSSRKNYDKIFFFMDSFAPKEKEFHLLFLNALVESGELARFESFLQKSSLSFKEYPQLYYYQAVVEFQKKNFIKAKDGFRFFLSNKQIGVDLRIKSLEKLLEISVFEKKPNEERNLIRELLSVLPDSKDLFLRLGDSYLQENREKEALKTYMDALAIHKGDPRILERASGILVKNEIWQKAKELLSELVEPYKHKELCFRWILTQMKTWDLQNARTHLKKLKLNHPGLEISKEFQFLDSDEELSVYLPENLREALFIQEETESHFMEMSKKQNTMISKSMLPPASELAVQIRVMAKVASDYSYKGISEVHIPEGSLVDLIEPEADSDQELDFFLVRYRGLIHRVKKKYIKIISEPAGEIMGRGKIVSLDENYAAMAQIRSQFKKSENIEVISMGETGLNRKIQINEDSFLNMESGHKDACTIRYSGQVFHDFNREYLSFSKELEILRRESFRFVVEIPAEERMALFGPDLAGVSIFYRSSKNSWKPLHQVVLRDQLQVRNFGKEFDRVRFRGWLVVDGNSDGVLDYFSIWQSDDKPMKGMLLAVMSENEREFENYFLPVDLRFIENFDRVNSISPLLFLRDLNQDGYLELLSSVMFFYQKSVKYNVLWFDIYQLDKKKGLVNVSSQHSGFYQQLESDLMSMQKKIQEEEKDQFYYHGWYSGYTMAMNRIRDIRMKK